MDIEGQVLCHFGRYTEKNQFLVSVQLGAFNPYLIERTLASNMGLGGGTCGLFEFVDDIRDEMLQSCSIV